MKTTCVPGVGDHVPVLQVATKCIRVSSTADAKQIIETLIEKFRPDMKMLEVPEYALYEVCMLLDSYEILTQ